MGFFFLPLRSRFQVRETIRRGVVTGWRSFVVGGVKSGVVDGMEGVRFRTINDCLHPTRLGRTETGFTSNGVSTASLHYVRSHLVARIVGRRGTRHLPCVASNRFHHDC